MRVYLASRYSRRAELQEVRKLLVKHNIEVTSRWLTQDHTLPDAKSTEAAKDEIPIEARRYAQDDLQDVVSCDVLVLFSERADTQVRRGGSHVEFGFALGKGKKVVICGPRANVFHTLVEVIQCRDLAELCLVLKELERTYFPAIPNRRQPRRERSTTG